MAIVIRKVNFIDILRTNIIISTNIKYIYLKILVLIIILIIIKIYLKKKENY